MLIDYVGELKVSEVLDYARRISYIIFAFAGYVFGVLLCGIMFLVL